MSKHTPITERDFNHNGFADWLAAQGAELCDPTNPYEIARYRAYTGPNSKRAETHVIYRTGKGTITWTGASRAHYGAFLAGANIDGEVP